MIEKIVYEYLKNALGVGVYMQRPEKDPKEFVLIEKTGSGKTNRVNYATFAFQSYAKTLANAALLNESVKEAAETMVELPEIGSVKLNSDYNFTDTASKQYRYQAVFVITHV